MCRGQPRAASPSPAGLERRGGRRWAGGAPSATPAETGSSSLLEPKINFVGRRMKKWNEKWNFSQIPEISSIFRIFLALFLKIFRTFVISWNFYEFLNYYFSWNSDKISSKSSRKITNFIDFCWNENENENVSFRQNFGRVFSWNFEVWAVQRNVNLVDLEKSWKMRLLSLS